MPSSDDRPTIGIDLGGTNIQAGVVDAHGKVIAHKDTKTKADKGRDEVMERLTKLVDKLMDKADLKRCDVMGLGIGAPGAIDIDRGVVIEAVNLGWNEVSLKKILEKKLKLEVVLDNDVNVGAWGEFRVGAGKDYDDLMALFIGTGIGGGLILGGKLYHGARFTAGEIGHTVVKPDAPLGEATLEQLASRSNIVHRLVRLIESNHESIVPKLVDGDFDKVRSKVLSEAFEKKDELTQQLIADAARYIGISIANAVTLLSLPCVVVGGGLTEAIGKPLIKQITEAFQQHVYPDTLRDCKIVASKLEDNAGLVGAALLARQKLG